MGDCFDNAMCESFFATLACELLGRRSFKTQIEARMAVFEFIEGWYNPHRRQSALDYHSPINYERSHLQETLYRSQHRLSKRGSSTVPATVNGLKHLRARCGSLAATGVALATGTSTFFVARELARLELQPIVIDAHEVRRKAQRPEQKNDTRDALELCGCARACAAGFIAR